MRPPPSRGQALGQDQHGANTRLGARSARLQANVPHRSLEDADLHRCRALRQDRCALRLRWADQWREFRGLRRANPRTDELKLGDIVILDNLGSHKGQPARAIIRAAGAHMIFLPPYSPDLNPIEQVFAKLKPILRNMARSTVEDTWCAIEQALNAFRPLTKSSLSVTHVKSLGRGTGRAEAALTRPCRPAAAPSPSEPIPRPPVRSGGSASPAPSGSRPLSTEPGRRAAPVQPAALLRRHGQ